MKFSTAVASILAAGMLMTVACPTAAQQAYPNRLIRFVVPYPPGGTTNQMARLIGQKLTESWGQPLIVDNRPGGNTIIGTDALAKSKPDGYTILLTSSIHIITPLLLPTPYDVVKDFAPVATTTKTEQMLVIHPSVPANNLKELMRLAKANPGQLNYASVGTGSPIHLAAELFSIMAGIKMQHVPYKGGGQNLTDLVGGHVHMAFKTPIAVASYVKSGRLRAMAISGDARFSELPQVPTFTQAGLPGFDARYWQGVFAPAGTPVEIVNKLSAEIAKIMLAPEMDEYLAKEGLNHLISTPAQFAALIKTDTARYARIIKTANIKADE